MVTKLVTWGDVHVGDTIRISIHSSPQAVLGITEHTAPLGSKWREVILEGDTVKITPNGTRCPSVHSPVLLVHRPWPEGRNELSMLAGITLAAHHLVQCNSFFPKEVQDATVELLEAIAAYELGRPLEPNQK